jgi:hypothetical protein
MLVEPIWTRERACLPAATDYRARMDDFESIRPYLDHEVPGVLASLVRDPELCDAVARYRLPRLAAAVPWLARFVARAELARRTRDIDSVQAMQSMLEHHVDALVGATTSGFTVEGLEALAPGRAYLFISNHRDIVMDTGLINLAIHRAGHQTSRIAVGDNLLTRRFAADLMRLNKSFVVERSAKGTKAVYSALKRTSAYIRCSLAEGHSVWIAQREGRSKDGFDRTDPALLKMLALAWKGEAETFGELVRAIAIVPVSVSYELDPCDGHKAHELCIRDATGRYEKPLGEDLESIVLGMLGQKGRVHVAFAAPVAGEFEQAEQLAIAIDEAVVGNLRIFPTHVEAARLCGIDCPASSVPELPDIMDAFRGRLARAPAAERPFLIEQYTNPILNQQSI